MSRSASPRSAEGAAAIGAAAVALALVAALTVGGSLARIDQYAVDHWLPTVDPTRPTGSVSIAHQFYPRLGSPLHVFCNLWTFPASAPVSAVVIAGCCLAFVRRGQRAAALAWAGAWLAANAVEVIGKQVLHKPDLHAVHAGLRLSFDRYSHSFPSGHALRAVLTAAAVAMVWRRAAWPALAWAVVVPPALVVNGAHTPSDVLGGVLLALLAVATVRASLRMRVAAA